nr:calponin-3 isoform X1 [Manis javanica]
MPQALPLYIPQFFFRTALRGLDTVSSNLAKSLDCFRGGSGLEFRLTGEDWLRGKGRRNRCWRKGPLFSGTGALRLLRLLPAAGGGALRSVWARWTSTWGGSRQRRRLSVGPAPAGLSPLREARKLTRTPGHWKAPQTPGWGAGRDPSLCPSRPAHGPAWRRGRCAAGPCGVRAEAGARDLRGEGARSLQRLNWPHRPLAREAGGGSLPLVGLVGQSLKAPGKRLGAVRGGIRRGPGGSPGPRRAVAEAAPALRRRVPASLALPRGASSEHLPLQPLLGAGNVEAECEKPPDPSAASSRRQDHHDPLQ